VTGVFALTSFLASLARAWGCACDCTCATGGHERATRHTSGSGCRNCRSDARFSDISPVDVFDDGKLVGCIHACARARSGVGCSINDQHNSASSFTIQQQCWK
jgi:hypothetical protein